MNQTMLALLVGLLAGIAGAFTVHLLEGGGEGGGVGGAADWQPVQERLASIERQLEARGAQPGTLATRPGVPSASVSRDDSDAGGALLAAAGPQALDALLARIDERVGATVEKKLEEARAEEGESSRRGRGRRNRKRVSLADAARELELKGQQEDELRRIFESSQQRMFKLMAGPDGDPEEVKREVTEAAKTPGGPQKLIPKYMPKVVSNLGEIMAIQAERESAIQKTLGPEKAQRFNNDYSVEEDDVLGLRGGQMNFEMEAGGTGR
jgi:hypothetical protein